MICDECKYCDNFHVSEVGCFGSDKPCDYFHSDDYIDKPKGKMKKIINRILCYFCKHWLICPYCKRYKG